jgi:hypothetical protein
MPWAGALRSKGTEDVPILTAEAQRALRFMGLSITPLRPLHLCDKVRAERPKPLLRGFGLKPSLQGQRLKPLLQGFGVVWLVGVFLAAGPVRAEEPNRAGLVIQPADGPAATYCIEFEGDEITGADLLTLSGLDVVVDASRGMGITVCQIEGQGCDFPAQPCFCQCMTGSGCAYWNYFYREGGGDWVYSPLGVLLRRIRSGSVEAWVWGDGSTPPAADLTFEAICPPAAGAPTPLPPVPTRGQAGETRPQAATPPPATPGFTPSPALVPTMEAALGQDGTPTVAATPPISPSPSSAPASPAPVATAGAAPPPTPAGEAPGSSPGSYWPFGLLLLVLALAAVVIRLRRR